MPTPSSNSQSIAAAIAAKLAAYTPTGQPAALTAIQTAIANGNLSLATYLDGLAANAWIEIGSGGSAPAFANSWVNFAGGFDTAAFYKDALGIVHLKGLIKSGTMGSAAFTLPVGFRPALVKLFPTVSNGLFGAVNIGTNGDVIASVGSNTYQTLDGISFWVG